MTAARSSEVLAEARSWLGTPYRHRASVRGAGADCLGLLRGLWRALYGAEPAPVPPYSPDWAEAGDAERLWRALAACMSPCPPGAWRPGEVILFRIRAGGPAKHLGLVSASEPARFIHAYPRHGVVESALSAPWARRAVAAFEFP